MTETLSQRRKEHLRGYSPWRIIGKNFWKIRPYILPGFLLLVIGVLSAVLISETAVFLTDTLGITEWKGGVYAIIIELVGVILVEILTLTPKAVEGQGALYLFRKIIASVLVGIFIFVTAATSMYATRPVLNDDAISASDKMMLRELDSAVKYHQENVASMKAAVDAVEGQPRNSAMRASDLSKASESLKDAIERKEQFIRDLKPSVLLETANTFIIIIMVVLRVLLQSSNWLLAVVLGKLVRSRFFAKTGTDSARQKPRLMLAESSSAHVGEREPWNEKGTEKEKSVMAHKSSHEASPVHASEHFPGDEELPEKQRPVLSRELTSKSDEGVGPKEQVTQIVANAECRKADGEFRVFSGSVILGNGKIPVKAWEAAAHNLAGGNGHGQCI